MPAATSPLATPQTSSWNVAALTPTQPSALGRLKTTASACARALVTTSSVRLPDDGGSMVDGVEYSRTCGTLPRRVLGPGPHPVRSLTGDPAAVDHVVDSLASGRGGRAVREFEMAEQTTSSITVDAPASAVMDVIADFDAYPQWPKGVPRAETRSTFDDGRAERVFFALDVSPIKDEYTRSTSGTATARSPGPWWRAGC